MISLKVDDYDRDVFIAVLDLNSNICRNTMPKVDFGPTHNYSNFTSRDNHMILNYDI